jgi:hypothetical protein
MARAGWLSDLMEGQSAHREWVQEKEAGVWVAAQAINRGLLVNGDPLPGAAVPNLTRSSRCEAGADRACAVAS